MDGLCRGTPLPALCGLGAGAFSTVSPADVLALDCWCFTLELGAFRARTALLAGNFLAQCLKDFT